MKDTCAKYIDNEKGKEMIDLLNQVSGFNFFAGRDELYYGLDEQLDTCVWNKHELKAFPEVRVVTIEEMIESLRLLKNKNQLKLQF